MKISRKKFGVLSNGKKVFLYILKAGDLQFCLSNFGAAWTSLMVPASKGGKSDVLLGFSGLDGYLCNGPFLGVTVGRFANRIGGAEFSLNGKQYRLDPNDNGNTLHCGKSGFDKRLWESEAYEESDGVYVRFTLDSPDGDGGFPGNLKAEVTYGLSKSNEIIARYEAKSDAPTPINLTNHAYFNLAGENSGSLLTHELRLHSSSYIEVDTQAIPTGRLLPVRDTPFDFRKRKPMLSSLTPSPAKFAKANLPSSNSDIHRGSQHADLNQETQLDAVPSSVAPLPTPHSLLPIPQGFDHCFTIDGDSGKLRPCAEVWETGTGRTMKVLTTQPGVQFYTGNMLPGTPGKGGSIYTKHTGFCLETQHFPDSPHQHDFPSCIFGPDRDYKEKAVFSFEVK